MKTKTITMSGFITFDTMRASRPDIWPVPFVFRSTAPRSGSNEILIKAHSFDVEVPADFDPRPGMIASLEAKKQEIQAEFAARVADCELPAIEYAPEDA